MTLDTLAGFAVWAIVLCVAIGAILAFVLKRPAAKVLGLLFFVLVAVTVFAIREHVLTLAERDPVALCAGRVSWFGWQLTGGSARCS